MALKTREVELDQRHSWPLSLKIQSIPSQTPDTTKPQEKSALSGLVLKRSPSWSSQPVPFLEIKAFQLETPTAKLRNSKCKQKYLRLRFQLSQSWWNLKTIKSQTLQFVLNGATGTKSCNRKMFLGTLHHWESLPSLMLQLRPAVLLLALRRTCLILCMPLLHTNKHAHSKYIPSHSSLCHFHI